MKRFIGVSGPQDAEEGICKLAEEVGYLIAQRGGILVCGGLAGVMEAACKGAKSAGGVTIGILPSVSKSDANPYVDFAIPTGLGEARNLIICRTADSLIAIGRSLGTLTEVAFALKIGKKVIGINTYGVEGITVASSPQQAVELAFG